MQQFLSSTAGRPSPAPAGCGFGTLPDAMDEARSFLALPRPVPTSTRPADRGRCNSDTVAMARRLFAAGQPIRGTLAERYLRARGIDLTPVDVSPSSRHSIDLRSTEPLAPSALRFHPAAFYREAPDTPGQTWPALLAAVTDPAGAIIGVQRTYLDPGLDAARLGKAAVASPRRSLGQLSGNGVRLRSGNELVLLVGEGLETVLSLSSLFPQAGAVAALSAAHLAMLALPSDLTTLLMADEVRAEAKARVLNAG